MKKNHDAEFDAVLCDSANTENLTRLNLHLRTKGINAVLVSRGKQPSAIIVPPGQLGRAQKVRSAWLKKPTELLSDYAKVRAKRPKEPQAV